MDPLDSDPDRTSYVSYERHIKSCVMLHQCWGSVTFWYGSGCGSRSSDPYLWLTDPSADPGCPKTYGSGSGTIVKSHKEVTKQKKSRFFLLFLLDDERIRMRIRVPNLCYTNREGGRSPAFPVSWTGREGGHASPLQARQTAFIIIHIFIRKILERLDW